MVTAGARKSSGGRTPAAPQPRFEAHREMGIKLSHAEIATPPIEALVDAFKGLCVADRLMRLTRVAFRPCWISTYPSSSGRAFALRAFFPGGYTEEVTPVPIPNTEVKLFRADGTAGATLWESRTLPGF